MISKTYGKFMVGALNKEIDFEADTIKCMLLNSHTPDQDVHQYLDDIQADEVTGDGYTAGGATVTGKSMTYDAPSNKVTITCGNITWGSSTITATHAVFYVSTGTASTSLLINYHDFEGALVSANGDFTVTIHANGLAEFYST